MKRINTKIKFKALYLLILLSLSIPSFANNQSQLHLNRILRLQEAPDGIIFELLTWRKATWDWAIPMIKDFKSQLIKKFPEIDIVVVSHGNEQFELLKDKQNQNSKIISGLRSLASEGVELNVCGAFSEMKNIPTTEYIDIVDVTASGPAQITDYIRLGYKHILLKKS